MPPRELLNSAFLSIMLVKNPDILLNPSTKDLPKNTAAAVLPSLPREEV
jgi:hypothetical protein